MHERTSNPQLLRAPAMPSAPVGSATPALRRPARDIIDAVVDNMRKNLEPLKYSTLAPSRYTVYLHATEFARLEGIIPVLQEQTTRALTDELQKLNRRSRLWRWADRWRRNTGSGRSQCRRGLAGRVSARPRRRHERRGPADRLRVDSARQPRPGGRRAYPPHHDCALRSANGNARADDKSYADGSGAGDGPRPPRVRR